MTMMMMIVKERETVGIGSGCAIEKKNLVLEKPRLGIILRVMPIVTSQHPLLCCSQELCWPWFFSYCIAAVTHTMGAHETIDGHSISKGSDIGDGRRRSIYLRVAGAKPFAFFVFFKNG